MEGRSHAKINCLRLRASSFGFHIAPQELTALGGGFTSAVGRRRERGRKREEHGMWRHGLTVVASQLRKQIPRVVPSTILRGQVRTKSQPPRLQVASRHPGTTAMLQARQHMLVNAVLLVARQQASREHPTRSKANQSTEAPADMKGSRKLPERPRQHCTNL